VREDDWVDVGADDDAETAPNEIVAIELCPPTAHFREISA